MTPLAVAPDLVAAAGADAFVDMAAAHLQAGRAVEALQLTDILLATEPRHAEALRVAVAAHEHLYENTTNFWERAWLRRSIAKLEKP
ncbi:unannotated protein [freshwater metagenome]|uniref:Unannotated protein n=1 Tax=freshwater metagenome TaxID=449393 RepID=A0A6J7UQQ7_9ZZZZ